MMFMGFVAQENKGVHTGPYHACIADISRELKSVAYAQQESFENVQARCLQCPGRCWLCHEKNPFLLGAVYSFQRTGVGHPNFTSCLKFGFSNASCFMHDTFNMTSSFFEYVDHT